MSVIFNSASIVALNIVENVKISENMILIIHLIFDRNQALSVLINYQFIAWFEGQITGKNLVHNTKKSVKISKKFFKILENPWSLKSLSKS